MLQIASEFQIHLIQISLWKKQVLMRAILSRQ